MWVSGVSQTPKKHMLERSMFFWKMNIISVIGVILTMLTFLIL